MASGLLASPKACSLLGEPRRPLLGPQDVRGGRCVPRHAKGCQVRWRGLESSLETPVVCVWRGQLPVFHSRGTRWDGPGWHVHPRVSGALRAFSPNPNTHPSALALRGPDTMQSLRPRLDTCCVPGPRHLRCGRKRG